MQRGKQYRWFLKYLFSYLLVLAIPLIVINGIYGSRVNAIYQQEILKNVSADLDSLSGTMDAELETMMRTVSQLALTVDFNKYDFEANPLTARPLMETLSTYCNTNGFVSDIILYLYDDAYLVSRSSTCRADLFTKWMYEYKNYTPQQFLQLLHSLDHLTVLPVQPVLRSGGEEACLTALAPLYTDYAVSRGACIFLVQSNRIHALVNQKLGKYSPALYITDHTGQLLYSNQTLPLTNKELAESRALQPAAKPAVRTVDGNQYIVCNITSDSAGWVYTAYIPREQDIVDRLYGLTRAMQTGTLLVVALVMVVIFFTMRVTYSPLSRLRKKAATMHGSDAMHGELETISNTLDFLDSENRSLTSQLEDTLSTTRNLRLQKLLTGRYLSREQFNEDCAAFNLNLPFDSFFVGCVLVQGTPDDWDALAYTMRGMLAPEYVSYYVFTPEPGRMYFINCAPPQREDALFDRFEAVRTSLCKATGLSLTIGLGRYCEGTTSIPRSFLEAGSALDYRFVKGNGNTILFREVLNTGAPAAGYPHRGFEKLRNAIAAQKDDAIIASVSELIDYLNKNNLPLFVAKGICFDILSLFFDTTEGATGYGAQTDLFLLSDMDTAHEVVDIITRLRDSLRGKEALPANENDSKKLIVRVLAYVDENCLRCDFSAQETAEQFGMLLPNLSQFFKEQTGQTILDYSAMRRMDRAKELLADTDIPLKELGYQVGYYNVSSFIRRFKQTQGLTPGDYRRLHGRDELS